MQLTVQVLISVMLITTAVVSAELQSTCTTENDCTTEHAFCQRAHSDCVDGTCNCGIGYQPDVTVCKEVINPGDNCADTATKICGGGSTCQSDVCECGTNLEPENNACVDKRAAIGEPCTADDDCRLGATMTECVGSPLACRCKPNFVEDEEGDQCNFVDWQGDCEDGALTCNGIYTCVTQDDNSTLCECQRGYVRTEVTNMIGNNDYMCVHQNATFNVAENGECSHISTELGKICQVSLGCYKCEEEIVGKCRSTPTPPTTAPDATTQDPSGTTAGASTLSAAVVLIGLLVFFRQQL